MEGVGAALGIIGMIQQKQQQDKQNDLIKKGMKMDDAIKGRVNEGLGELQDLARGYDPRAETTAAIADASKVTGDTLERSMRNLVAEYSKGGGIPGLSSEWNVKTQGLTNRVTDPLRRFAAERAAGDTQRKMNAWSQAIGAAPGNFGDSYFKAAQMVNVPNGAGSFQALLQGLMSMGKKGSGGSGDVRGAAGSAIGGIGAGLAGAF
jgi:hypothetical protein